MGIIQVNQIANKVKKHFEDKIDLSDVHENQKKHCFTNS